MKNLIFSLLICLIIGLNAYGRTPYHSLDENNYDDVVKNLKTPEQLANYIYYNFQYSSDIDQYGKYSYNVDSKTMFIRKQGDCEDYAEFANAVLQYHGINSKIYFIYSINASHAITIFFYKGCYNYIDTFADILHTGFSSSNEIINSIYENNTVLYESKNNAYWYKFDEITDNYKYKNKYIGYERLNLHYHLTKCNYGFHYYMPGIYDNERKTKSANSYIKNPNKLAMGFLFKIENNYLNGMGFSFSGHGYYDTFTRSKKMLSFHFLFLNSKLGITPYFGDYNGIDFDINFINLSFLKGYGCIRNFGEVFDFETDLIVIQKYLNLKFEKADKQYLYGTEITFFYYDDNSFGLNINNLIIETVLNIKPISLKISFNIQEKDLTSIKLNITF